MGFYSVEYAWKKGNKLKGALMPQTLAIPYKPLLDDLRSSGQDRQNQAFQAMLKASDSPVDWAYEVWDDLRRTLVDGDNRQRSIAAQVLSNLAKSDPQERMLRDLPALLKGPGIHFLNVLLRHCRYGQQAWINRSHSDEAGGRHAGEFLTAQISSREADSSRSAPKCISPAPIRRSGHRYKQAIRRSPLRTRRNSAASCPMSDGFHLPTTSTTWSLKEQDWLPRISTIERISGRDPRSAGTSLISNNSRPNCFEPHSRSRALNRGSCPPCWRDITAGNNGSRGDASESFHHRFFSQA
jgi:hypothetical protein